MESGGVSKSMSSLLNVIDVKKYEVDLFITNPTGVFMDLIPPAINIIKDEKTRLLFSSFPKNLLLLLKKGYVFSLFVRMIAALLMLINKGYGAWILSRMMYTIKKEYDLAIDYNGQHQLYYLVDKIKATKKASFFHSDYKMWSYYYSMDKLYYPKLDALFTISDICVNSLIDFFPNVSENIHLMENISVPLLIEQMANQLIEDMNEICQYRFVTVGHVCKTKGSDLAIETAALLKEKGLDFKWYFIGGISDKEYYLKKCKAYDVQNEIVYLGLKTNPYPYIKKADLFIQPSLFEGKSIALDEAKLLCKPIVVTNFSTVNDQFTNGYNATITDFSVEKITSDIYCLVNDKKLQDTYKINLELDKHDNAKEIHKLYNLIP